jgi:beta-lactamase class D
VSKTNNLKARIQGKKTPAEAFIEAGLLNQQTDNNDENIDVNRDVNVDKDVTINDNIDINNAVTKFDLNALRQKVKQQTSKEKKTRFEDRHRKLTVWVENEAFEALQLLAANKKGEKTRIVTEALMKYASEYLKK